MSVPPKAIFLSDLTFYSQRKNTGGTWFINAYANK